MSITVVLGFHRSGTSLIANLLHHMGISMGERFREPDKWNADGYYEDLDFVELNRQLIPDWTNPPSDKVLNSVAPAYARQISDLIELKSQQQRWGWKDPRNCLLMPLYEPYLPEDTKYIYAKRNLEDVFRSVNRREKEKRGRVFSDKYLLNLYARYIDACDSFLWLDSYYTKSFQIVDYDELTHNPDDVITRIARFMSIDEKRALEQCQGIVRSSV